MDIINLLPEHIANQIAAGEVIQRPASVVKETLENSIDSGASEIQLIIKDAGKTLIQIIDNGCGMSNNDVEKCFLRHATSKIKKANDLFAIQTMGFRGEAMASIASISHVELETKLHDKELGTKIIIEGGNIKRKTEHNCKGGTSIKIKNIFFNIPARRKFLKSDNVEMRHIIEEFSRIALSNPNCKMQLIHNEKELFYLEENNFRQRIVSVIGLKNNEHLVPISENTDLVKIDGFICKPEYAKKSRGEQYIFVNKRYIKNYQIQSSISRAFEGLISEKYYPSYFINLTIDPERIDVNIHPTKTEIKFEDEKSIYAILRSSVQKSLGEYNISPSIDFLQENSFNIDIDFNRKVSEPKIKVDPNYNPFQKMDKTFKDKNEDQQIKIIDEKKFDENYDFIKISSQLFLKIGNQEIQIIHKTRAHQRILYEYYLKSIEKPFNDSQKLAFTISLSLSNKDFEIFKEIEKDLISIGFLFEYKEENTINFIGLPTSFKQENLKESIQELIEDYQNLETIENTSKNKLALSLSKLMKLDKNCNLNNEEMRKINDELMKCEHPNFSPTGKPIIMNLDINEVNKFFK